MVQRIINFILSPIRKYKEKQAFKKKLEEMRKRDPFIYK